MDILTTIFNLKCDKCSGDIRKGEKYGITHHRSNGEEINVLQAYNLRASEKYSVLHCKNCLKPTPEEIKEYMELHNADECAINDQWTLEDAEYHLLLSDKYYYLNK